jgi:hypothetical protein
MSSERSEEFSQPPIGSVAQTSADTRDGETAGTPGPSDDSKRPAATVLVRGETIRDQEPKSPPKQMESARKQVSEPKVKMQSRLRSRPLTWMDAATAFFGYDPLSKALYRKLGGQFEEHIS